MLGTFLGDVKAQAFSLVRGFTFESLDQMETHFKDSPDYHDGFCHLLAVAKEFILDNRQQLDDSPGAFAQRRDGYIQTILEQIEHNDRDVVRYIPQDKIVAFKAEFPPVLMAYFNFIRQHNETENMKPVEVQGAHGDSMKYYIYFALSGDDVKGYDIGLFKKENDNSLVFVVALESAVQGKDVVPVVENQERHEITEVTEVTQTFVPAAVLLSTIHPQPHLVNIPISPQPSAPLMTAYSEFYPGPVSAPLNDHYLSQQHLNQMPYQLPQNSGQYQPTLGVGGYCAESRHISHASGYQSQFNQQPASISQPPVVTNLSGFTQGPPVVYSDPHQQQFNWGNPPPQNYPVNYSPYAPYVPYQPTANQPQGWSSQPQPQLQPPATNYATNYAANYATSTAGYASHVQGQANYAPTTSPYPSSTAYSGQPRAVTAYTGYENNPFVPGARSNQRYENNPFAGTGSQGYVTGNSYAPNYSGQTAYPPTYPSSHPPPYQ